jgi:predicted aspartyl protease
MPGASMGQFLILVSLLALIGIASESRSAEPPVTGKDFALTVTPGSRLTVAARINGLPVDALLDTAAEVTILDRAFAKKLKLDDGQSVAGQGSGKASFDASLVSGVTLEALDLTLRDQTIAVADLSDVGRRLLGRRIDVILGREIFDAARLSIDIDGHLISVAPRNREPQGVRLDLVTEHGVETIPVRVESGDEVRATFDLGNGSDVLIGNALATRMNLLSDGRQVSVKRGGGLGGEAARQVITLRSIEVAGRRFNDISAAIDPQPSASDVNVGVALLRHFRITTDFANHAVWLEPLD